MTTNNRNNSRRVSLAVLLFLSPLCSVQASAMPLWEGAILPAVVGLWESFTAPLAGIFEKEDVDAREGIDPNGAPTPDARQTVDPNGAPTDARQTVDPDGQ